MKTPSDQMLSEPLQDPIKICEGCPNRSLPLPTRRVECETCRKIFKADLLVLQEQHSLRPTLTPGRKPTRYKTHGQTVKTLRAEGRTLHDISKITGLAINTIRKILKECEQTMKTTTTATTTTTTTKSIEYLTQTEHARRLGLSRQAIYKAQKFAPRFKTVKFNRRDYYVWEDGRPVFIGEK